MRELDQAALEAAKRAVWISDGGGEADYDRALAANEEFAEDHGKWAEAAIRAYLDATAPSRALDGSVPRELRALAADLGQAWGVLPADMPRSAEARAIINATVVTLNRLAASHAGDRERWRHVKRGTVYEVLGEAGLQSEWPQSDGQRLVIYQGEAGDLWARPPSEFNDGRFKRLARAAGQDDAGEVKRE